MLTKSWDPTVQPIPLACGVCDNPLGEEFVDGNTAYGWQPMCPPCHTYCGCGFGPTKGKRYVLQADGTYREYLTAKRPLAKLFI